MTKYLLDTSILLGYLRGAKWAQYLECRLAPTQPPNLALVSVVSHGEILSLAAKFAWGKRKRKNLDELLRELSFVDISSPAILAAYAEIDAMSENLGRKMGKNDVWIAATAKVLDAVILTTDKDFDHLEGVHLQRFLVDQALGPEDA